MAIRLEIKKIPAFPHVALQILALDISELDYSSSDVESILHADHALTGNVLRLANSPEYGRAGSIGDLKSAINLLGMRTIVNIALVMSTQTMMKPLQGPPFYDLIPVQSIVGALVAREICHRAGPLQEHAQLALIGGLLRDIGMLAIAVNARQAYEEILDEHLSSGGDLLALERAGLQTDHVAVGDLIMKRWELPERLAAMVRFHEHGVEPGFYDDVLPTVVALADAVSKRLSGVASDQSQRERESNLQSALHLPLDFTQRFDREFLEGLQNDPIYAMSLRGS